MSSRLIVHHLEQSRSHRIVWMMEELGVDYDMVEHKRHPKTKRAGKELRDIHPLGKAPMVVLPDGAVLAESGAILEELVELYGPQLRPIATDVEQMRRYRYFMHYAEGSLMPPLLVKLILSMLSKPPVPAIARPITRGIAAAVDKQFTDPEIELQLRFLDGELASRTYVCGDLFTAADIQLSFPLDAGASRADLSRYPNVGRYLERLRARPAWQRATEKAGAFTGL